MRVAILTSVPPVALGYAAAARALGHDPVVVIVPRRAAVNARPIVEDTPPELDVLFAATKRSLARMLGAYEVDVGLCTGFPWLVPREALETPPLGIVNGHPSLLPRYRGPFPIAWAVRNGEEEIGMSYHFMDADFDTGNLLAQTRIPLAADDTWETVVPKLEAAAQELLPTVFRRLEAGDPGDAQPEEGEYQSEFEEDYERIDASRTAAEVHAQVRAWSFVPEFAQRGPRLGDLRVTRTSLTEIDGADRLDCADGPVWIVASEPV